MKGSNITSDTIKLIWRGWCQSFWASQECCSLRHRTSMRPRAVTQTLIDNRNEENPSHSLQTLLHKAMLMALPHLYKSATMEDCAVVFKFRLACACKQAFGKAMATQGRTCLCFREGALAGRPLRGEGRWEWMGSVPLGYGPQSPSNLAKTWPKTCRPLTRAQDWTDRPTKVKNLKSSRKTCWQGLTEERVCVLVLLLF